MREHCRTKMQQRTSALHADAHRIRPVLPRYLLLASDGQHHMNLVSKIADAERDQRQHRWVLVSKRAIDYVPHRHSLCYQRVRICSVWRHANRVHARVNCGAYAMPLLPRWQCNVSVGPARHKATFATTGDGISA